MAAAVVGLAAAAGGGYYLLNKPVNTQGGPGGSVSPVASPPASSAPGSGGPARPSSVEVAKVEKTSLQDDAQAVGSLRARQNIMLRPEVSGRVLSLGFTDGNPVRKGQLMVQLDDVLQRAEVKQSQAQVSIAQANFKRNQELVAQNFVAQRVLEESGASLQVAQAQLSLSCARLSRMRIDAPFSGVVGIRTVNLGDYVKDGADLVNIEDISSMWADFRLPERFQNKVKKGQTVELLLDAFPGRQFKAKIEAIDPAIDANARSISVRAALPNTGGEAWLARAPGGRPGASAASVALGAPIAGAAKPPAKPPTKPTGPARKTAPAGSDSAVAPSPSSPEWQVCQANDRAVAGAPAVAAVAAVAAPSQGGPLRPGMFVRATAIFGVRDNALIVPEEAIVPQGGRQFVFKVVPPSAVPGTATAALSPDITQVSQRAEVRVGVRRPGRVEIESTGAVGLAEGDTIVTAGQQRLQRDGSPIRVVDLARPAGAGSAPAASSAASSAASGAVFGAK